ncbi:uncharacterized protein BDZ99DRAFT_459039 [Mytilinidion resinicola]|uniref:Uncharacterized protein n=1 Tax=Mytilinidion resinicola TaxID=574789 RepID=A0A6A6Z4J7_9PEZI|nr:uncharacterized protein BDZ99DRAFT_459039 [Mytilinidion resinicola]KAF2815095.1 hypothetical protein BDZ99DRAFT_459039 [Mytilinidion resinicola]
MASFARGFSCVGRQTYFNLPPSLRVATAPRSLNCLHSMRNTRHFSFSSIRRLAESKKLPKKQNVPPTTPGSRPTKKPGLSPKTHVFNPNRMPIGSKPILLYKAPSQAYYAVVAYAGAGATAFGAAFIFKNFWLELPPELPKYVGVTYGGMAVLLALLSAWICAAPVFLIRSIHAIPFGYGLTALRIECKTLPLPFFKPIVAVVRKGDAQCSGHLGPQVRIFEKIRARNYQDLWAGTREESIVLRPFFFAGRWVARLWSRVFTHTKVIIGRWGMVIVDIPGEGKWKLDGSGWVADGGKPFDQMISVIPPSGLLSR